VAVQSQLWIGKYGAIIEHHQTNIGGFDVWGHEYKENINYQPVVK